MLTNKLIALRGTMLLLLMVVLTLSCEEEEVMEMNDLETPTAAVGDMVSISNAGFESNWSGWNDVDPSSISGNSNSGSKSAKITGSSGRFTQTVSVSTNTNYTLSAYIRGRGTIGATAGGSSFEDGGNYSGWTKLSVQFSTGSNSSVTIYGEYNGGEGRFDDFEMVEGQSTGGGGSGYTSIPAKIEAEDFDSATEGRTQGTSDTGGGLNVGWIDNGESLSYNVNVPSAGSYDIDFRVASRSAGINFAIYQGNNQVGSVSAGATGGWQNWTTITRTVSLSAGQSTIKVEATAGGWNINWLEFKQSGNSGGGGSGPGAGTAAAIIGSGWKLNGYSGTLNVGASDNGLNYVDDSNTGESHYFFERNGYAAFRCYPGNPTSGGSSNPRSELREIINGGNGYWNGNTNTEHSMKWRFMIEDLPPSGKLAFGQIHERNSTYDDVIRVQVQGSSGQNSGSVDLRILGYVTEQIEGQGRTINFNMSMDTEYYFELTMQNGVVKLYNLNNSGNRIQTLFTSVDIGNADENYFKAGCYLQSTSSSHSSSSVYGQVLIKDLTVSPDN